MERRREFYDPGTHCARAVILDAGKRNFIIHPVSLASP